MYAIYHKCTQKTDTEKAAYSITLLTHTQNTFKTFVKNIVLLNSGVHDFSKMEFTIIIALVVWCVGQGAA